MKAKNGIWSGRRVLVTGGIFFKPIYLSKRATDCAGPGLIVRAIQERPDAEFSQVVEDRVVEGCYR
jgi:hypothetical protein